MAEMGHLSKPVQELVMEGQQQQLLQLPESYMYKGGVPGYTLSDLPPPLMDLPFIDVGLLQSGTSLAASLELEKLSSGLSSWGCFMAINHGMEMPFLDKIRSVMKQFFALSMEEKQKYSRVIDDIEGYGTDTVLFENQVLDWDDRLYLIIHPEDRRNLKYWPQTPEDFRETLQQYTEKLHLLVQTTLKAMAMSLNLEERCFIDNFGVKPEMHARFNFYPACSRPDVVLGLKPHADGSTLTVILPDKEVAGLQFLKDDQWYRVPVNPEALLINIGDQLEMISNGVFKSPVHRVVTNSERDRITMAVFCTTDPDKDINPVDALVSDSRPRMYKSVKNYPAIYFQHYQTGKRPIEAEDLIM